MKNVEKAVAASAVTTANINAASVKVAPATAPRSRYLTAEQRAELHGAVRCLSGHMLTVSNVCGPLNQGWIKDVVLTLANKLVKEFNADDPALVVPFLLSLTFPQAAFASPHVLEDTITARLNAIHEIDPDILNTVIFAGMMIADNRKDADAIDDYFSYASLDYASIRDSLTTALL